MDLGGKKVLVTGASRGIGQAIAEAFLLEGASVWGTSRDASSVNWEDGVQGISLDLSSATSIEECWASHNLDEIGFDVLINNAGSCHFGSFSKCDHQAWHSDIEILLLGAMRLSHLALPGLIQRRGYLVNVSSMASEFPIPFMSGYNAAKAGLSAFSESLMMEPASGLKVLDVRLGDFRTGFNADMQRPSTLSSAEDRVWNAALQRVERSPEPEKAAKSLIRAIRRNRTGILREGSYFQTIFVPFFARFFSRSLQRYANKLYYKLQD